MKIAKYRDGAAWRIKANDRITNLFIIDGDRPKYREPKTYWVMEGEDYLFACKSVSAAMRSVERVIANACARPSRGQSPKQIQAAQVAADRDSA